MNSKITKSSLVVALLGLSTSLFAQDSPTSTSPRFGEKSFRTWSVGVHGGILSPNTIFGGDSERAQEFKSIGYGAFIKKQIIPTLGLQADFMRGKIKSIDGVGAATTNFEHSINWSGALTAVWNVANININKENAVLVPYLKGGAGYMASKGSATTGSTTIEEADYREGWFIPVGAGFKLGVAKGINLDLGYDVNFVKSPTDYKGRFAYAHAGLEFALGNANKPQLANYSALANLRKQSAEESAELRAALSTAEQNAQRDRDQLAKDLGDDDADGVANKFDKCAGTPSGTVVDGSGCPLAAVKPQIIKETKVIVTDADRKVVKDAISNLEFDLGKSTIRSKSNATLDKVAALLVEKNFSLKLAGHTDNTGSRELNLRLSKERAEAVRSYLVEQGANASRIEAVGYGPDQPISTNKTAKGRQENRRVEFTIY